MIYVGCEEHGDTKRLVFFQYGFEYFASDDEMSELKHIIPDLFRDQFGDDCVVQMMEPQTETLKDIVDSLFLQRRSISNYEIVFEYNPHNGRLFAMDANYVAALMTNSEWLTAARLPELREWY